ncbi:MAG: 2-oxo-4-hydroxy-4-carboxy-5-ureidoimidazoline decarboxylase [Vulcanimicrobiaceae bacterium]
MRPSEVRSSRRPFTGVDALLACMNAIVAQSPLESRVALIAAHPDLAGRVAREGRLTVVSGDEQASAGLDRLTPEETLRFETLNAAYRQRFGFPFVICVRENTKASILDELQDRVRNGREAEMVTALREIGKIAEHRLKDALTG